MNSQTALADLLAGLGQPTPTKPAGPPCLDPWCANGVTPCGHPADAHYQHHGAAAILTGTPTTTQASARIAASAPTPKPAAAGVETGDLGRAPAAAPRHTENRADCTCHADNSLYGGLATCLGCGHRSFDSTAQACERRRCGHVAASPPPPPTGPPSSTVAEMREVLADLDASRPRSQQTALGPSELGTPCQRQIAMKLAGLPRQPDKRPPWAPMQGTAIHGLMEEALRFHNAQLGRDRWVIEERLHMDAEISGSGDAFDTDTGTVVDWKHVGKTALRDLRRRLPNEQLVKATYRVQAHLYGYGHARAGRDVRWVRLVLLARSHDYDESAEWTEPYQPDIAIKALDRYYATQDLLGALDLDNQPALWAVVPAAPSEDACAWCPFRRPGGPADATGCPGNTDQKVDKQLRGLIA